MEIHEDVAGRVGGAVLSEDDFVVKINALGQDAVQGLGDESLMVIGDHHHAELHASILACKLTVARRCCPSGCASSESSEINYMIATVGDVPDNLGAILCPRLAESSQTITMRSFCGSVSIALWGIRFSVSIGAYT